jgi:hypothetical protein
MNYWDKRYANGGNSGCGSTGYLREWKWQTIELFVNPIIEVIDVGCGDLSFWDLTTLPKGYVGIDASEVIIQKNRINNPTLTFYHAESSTPLGIVAPVVFCFDMLFHIMDDDVYKRTIENLCRMSSEYIFIYTWVNNPLRKFWFIESDRDEYERFRDLEQINTITSDYGFKGISVIRNETLDRFGAMLVFRRKVP